VDAALELSKQGHDVHLFTAHHDPNRCFEETVDGESKISVSSAEFTFQAREDEGD
jgi:alpha-1,3/alpha-1,6-mannosyltransferase